MPSIAVCDDSRMYVNRLTELVEKYNAERGERLDVRGFTDPLSLLAEKHSFDIYFLDIEMPGANGLELAKKINSLDGEHLIFFITNYESYLDEAFDMHAFRYLYKPVDTARLFRGLDLALQRLRKNSGRIELHIMEKTVSLPAASIIYMTIEKRHCRIVTTTGEKTADDRLRDIFKRLPEGMFAYSHKSYVVNLAFVTGYDSQRVLMKHGSSTYEAYMSRRMLPAFRHSLLLYARGAV